MQRPAYAAREFETELIPTQAKGGLERAIGRISRIERKQSRLRARFREGNVPATRRFDKVQVMCAVTAMQTARHVNPMVWQHLTRPCKKRKDVAPTAFKRELRKIGCERLGHAPAGKQRNSLCHKRMMQISFQNIS